MRAYLAYLHDCAKVIQRNFRGHLGREDYRQRLEVSDYCCYESVFMCVAAIEKFG